MAGYGFNEARAALEAAQRCEISKYICPTAVCTSSTECCAPCKPAPRNLTAKELRERCGEVAYLNKVQQEKEKESTMYNDYNSGSANLETQQRNHLKRRLDDAFQSKKTALKTKFNINYDATPKTLQGLKDMIAAGNIKIDESMFTAEGKFQGWGRVMDTLSFIDPTKVTDEVSYKTARADLETKLQAAKDIALVAPLADGLKALQDFEATA